MRDPCVRWNTQPGWLRWGLTVTAIHYFSETDEEWARGIRYHNMVAAFLDNLESEGGQAGYFEHGYLHYFDVLTDAEAEEALTGG